MDFRRLSIHVLLKLRYFKWIKFPKFSGTRSNNIGACSKSSTFSGMYFTRIPLINCSDNSLNIRIDRMCDPSISSIKQLESVNIVKRLTISLDSNWLCSSICWQNPVSLIFQRIISCIESWTWHPLTLPSMVNEDTGFCLTC